MVENNTNSLGKKHRKPHNLGYRLKERFLLSILKVRYIYLFKYWSFSQKSVAFLALVLIVSLARFSQNELQADKPKFYIVKDGSSLYKVSKDYKVNTNDLIIWNNISNEFTIHPSQKLAPNEDPDSTVKKDSVTIEHQYASQDVYHSLQKGENLYRLSLRYNVSVDSIILWNNIKDVSNLDTGMKLIVGRPGNSSKGSNIVAVLKQEIPPVKQSNAIYYKVKPHDNILRIALAHNAYISNIVAWNNIKDINSLDTGILLIVGYVEPAGTSPEVVVQTPVPAPQVKEQPAPIAKTEPAPVQEQQKATASVDTGTKAHDTTKVVVVDAATKAKNDSAKAALRKDSVLKEQAIARALSNKKSKWLQPKFYINRLRHQPWLIAALIICTTLFMFGVITLITMVVILRIRSTVNEAISHNFSNAFEDLITGVIYADHDSASKLTDDEFDDAQLGIITGFEKKYLSNPFHRQLCIDHLLNLYRNLTGISAMRVVNLYHEFKLNNDSLGKVKNRQWHIKAKGIQEVEQMHVQDAYKLVYKFIDNPIDTLRYESQIAVMSLKDEKNLVFLEELKLPLTEWQQMMLANKLHIIRNRDFSNMEALLSCSNLTVVCLAIKIVQDFNMLAYVPRLIDLLKHDSPDVKMASANALGGLIAKDAIPALFLELRTAPSLVKERILSAAAVIGIDDHLDEVAKYVFHDNFEVAHAAANALVSAGEKGINALREIVSNNEENIGIQVFNSFN